MKNTYHNTTFKYIKSRNKIYNITSYYSVHFSVSMDSLQTYIIENSGTAELLILIRIQLWELTSLFLEQYTYILRSLSKKEF